ncbi:DNA-protecting protein DprA [Trinickia dabaoshanensis]|uniref:DNA-protecting protein DprA n=1 Tax=Trinickia dabaoshanensis TaxID=564714 RepID=A0A2N7VSN1_9BURK|nr:DNA-processing protein DprA [Trinickia dabaoshanensis]PMS20158.1 DNA-protecting protein DprA [Trinickia dabaoshanensis]
MNARAPTSEQLHAWLALTSVRALKPAILRALLAAFGDARSLLAQPFEALADEAGSAIARAVAAAARADVREQVDRTLAWCAAPGHALVTLDDPAYPCSLFNMHDPPPLLYVSGQLQWLHAPSVAIVGSRNATPQGAADARRFARELARAGLVVVSGLALGVDAAAHRGALDAGGATLAVVGTGADLVYPAQHHALADEIAACGAIVSEWPLATPAKPAHFPQRNRLIAGLTRGVLVVEAALRSGSLITARLSNEMGRDVFAVPGSIHSPVSRGCHQLIKDGAMLVETAADVLQALGLTVTEDTGEPQRADRRAKETQPSRQRQARRSSTPRPESASKSAKPRVPAPALPLFDTPPPALSPDGSRLLEALGHAPAALEILAGRTDMDSGTLQGALLELELRGYLTVLPGGRYVRHTEG